MKVFVYIRVSTNKQDLEVQRNEVLKHCEYRHFEVIRVFDDIASGKSIDRKKFNEMLQILDTNPFGIDAVVIYKLDRIGRSIRDLINISDQFQKKNIGLIAIASNIDTTTKEGRLFYYMMSAFAEYERELIQERTLLGINVAKNAGKICHRPKMVLNIDDIKTKIAQGIPKSKIAQELGVSRGTIYNRL